MTMDARKFRILQAIIDDYILTAIPVGSRTISKKYEMGLSSATIRNEMSDLEELGYLDQPHVSAGRIPSAKAYRLYVDQLLKNGSIRTGDAADVRAYFTNRAQQMEDVISRAAQVLSGLTHYTSLVMSPKGAELRIRTLQLVPVSSQSALLVIVTDGGIMRDSVIREERTPKKESRSEFDLAGISGSSSISKSEISTETTHERPSVLAQLKGYREQLNRQHKAAPARSKQKGRPEQR